MVRKIKWTVHALNDLNDIYKFIAKDSKRYARIQVENIQKAVTILTDFPSMGRKVPEFPLSVYREILVGNYRVLYRWEEDIIMIMSVAHGRQLLKEPVNL